MNVRKLTVAEKDLLVDQVFKDETCFNPTQDADGNWIISEEEVTQNEDVQFNWINDLPTIPHNPVIVDLSEFI